MKLLRHIGLWGPVVAFMVLLLWVSDKLVGPPFLPVWDKLAHVVIYGALALLCLRATHGGLGPLRAWPTLVALGLTLAYGLVDELNQRRIPGRDPGLLDWLADVVGAGIAVLLIGLVLGFGPRIGPSLATGDSGPVDG